jgi:predicted small lipoprotein YifL
MKTILRLLLLASLVAMAACGTKGPLYLPVKATTPAPHPPPAPASVPNVPISPVSHTTPGATDVPVSPAG